MDSRPRQADSVQQQARRQQQVEELCAAAVRALAADASLHYRGGRLHRGTRLLAVDAPHLRQTVRDPVGGSEDFASRRALVDAIALRLQHSDQALHRRLRPSEPVERLIFELLEQLRVETLVPPEMPGMAANLQHRFEAWSRAFHRARLTETRLGLLLYALAQSCWSRLNARPVLHDTEEIIETTRAKLVRPLGTTLAGLRRDRRDQGAYARHALDIARIVAGMVRAAQALDDSDGNENAPDEAGEPREFALLLDFDSEEPEAFGAAPTGESKAFERGGSAYRVYDAGYDREMPAASLVRAPLLRELRERLDERVAEQAVNLARLARQLSAVLARPRRDGWRFGEEEGRIDGRRLAQLVSSPTERRVFRREQYLPRADCAIGLLVDCSGSMKEHAEPLAVVVDLLVRALEICGAQIEVLGFTTGAWNGGRPYRHWLRAGRPGYPGRLNEALHLVFKDARRNWRRSRGDLAALLKPDLFREGLDGEAVEWACARLRARAAQRRILIVFSDGCPMDTATARANDPFYLDNHLKQVVARCESSREVELLAVGVGLDLSPFYSRCLATDLSRPIDNELFSEIVRLIDGRRQR